MNGKPRESVGLYITHVDHVGPYLSLLGQLNHDAIHSLSKRIEQLLPTCFTIEQSWTLGRQQALLVQGTFCIFKRTNGVGPDKLEYMRTRVVNAYIDEQHLDQLTKMRVEIEFLDYGYKRTVDSRELIFPKQPQLLQNVPILCSHFIVLGICTGWEKEELDVVNSLLLNQAIRIDIEDEICGHKFVNVFWRDFNFADFLVQQKQIGAPISNQLLMDHCKKLLIDASQSALGLAIGINNNSTYNNKNMQSISSAIKSPTDLAREQLAARRSLSARLELQRTIPRQLHMDVQEQLPKQLSTNVQLPKDALLPVPKPLANVTNVMPPAAQVQLQALVNMQKPASNLYNRASYQPNEQLTVAPIPTQPMHDAYMPKNNLRPLNTYLANMRLAKPMRPPAQLPFYNRQAPMRFAPARPYAQTVPLQPAASATMQRVIPAFKSTSLTVGLTYDVYVSFVENGPHLFWIHLKPAVGQLEALMSRIERTRMLPLNIAPDIGTACVARFAEDNMCYRALICAIYGNKYRVVYVDYGNSALVELRDLYNIPQEMLDIKPFAFRFTLAGTKELEPIDESMKRIFKEHALYMMFQLTVQAAESVGAVQTCHLRDRDGNNVLDLLKSMKNSFRAYAKAEQLENDDAVEIRFIDSPSNFYVQKVDNIKRFQQLMDQMFAYYNTNQKVPQQLVLGSPCIVKCDQEWYRAEILRVDAAAVIVRHVDFGFEQSVQKHLIGNIAEQHLKMPRQAIKCCLKGFENSELGREQITDQFEMLAEESNIRRRTFTVRVFRIEPDGVNVVNLLAKNLNVMKKLYKFSIPFNQYLSLERDQFNTSITPSLTSSTVMDGQLEKGNVLNSTTVESEVRMRLQKQTRVKNSEWDKHSSSSSRDNRDSQNSGNEQRQSGATKRSSQQKAEWHVDVYVDAGFDTRSTSSYASGMSSPRKGNRQNGRVHGQNGKQEASKNARFGNIELTRKEQQARQSPRSQNAPQGFAQKPQRQKSTLDGSNSKKSSSGESDVVCSNSKAAQEKSDSYVPLDRAFALQDIRTPQKEAASISWWVSPFQFYVVPKSAAAKYDSLLREMKQFYRQKPHQPLQLKVGSSVVVRQRKDGAIWRATVQGCNHMLRKYRVFCVDTGNMCTVTSEDVWQLEQRFAGPPCLAYRCSLHSVVSNYDHLYIVDRMEQFVPANAKVECEFLEKQQHQQNTFIVNIFVNGGSLQDMLVKANFLTQVPPEVRVGLLAGQQIRGKFTSIRDMTNFKIQLECCSSVNFLCSYDDAKFVKANLDLGKPFKEHYEGKSYAFNVKDVCENNIIHLRPIMPLFKEDRDTFICTYPIVLSTFRALVVYIAKSYRIYVQPSAIDSTMKQMLDDMYAYYETKGKPLTKFEKDQICAARSGDGNWYRARMLGRIAKGSQIEVFYLDYGNTEKLSRDNIRVLEPHFYINMSSYGIEINLPIGRCTNDDKLKAQLSKTLEDQLVTIKPIEVRRNHIIADVILDNKQSIFNTLKAEKLVATQDIDFIRKLLDKEKSHTFEYIETVDLTEDDEDEKKKEPSKSPSSVNSSPKSKKQEKKATNKSVEQLQTVAATQPLDRPAIKATGSKMAEKLAKIESDPTPFNSPAVVGKVTSEPQIADEAQTLPQTDSVELPVVAAPPDPYKDMEPVVLSHCDNPAQFYVHAIDKLSALHIMQENLQIVSPSLPQLMNVVDGAECISLYSVDKQWYRAKIIDAELMVLKFIDYGNTDCVSDTTDIRETMWSHIEPFCAPCALPIAPKGTADWVDAANALFNDSYTKVLHLDYLLRGDCLTRSYVNLFIEGVDVGQKLIADGYAKPLEYVCSGSTCFISHVNSISDFYIQLERDCKALELIEMYLRDAEQHLQQLQSFEKSKIVAALFEEDELWYRAELLRELSGQRYEVRFIDYGNTSITPKCLLLSEEIANLPSLSKKCALQLPKVYTSWSGEAEAKFEEISGEGELVFTTQLLQPRSDHVVIHLFVDEDNVIDKLLPLCTRKEAEPPVAAPMSQQQQNNTEQSCQIEAIITHMDNPTSFYLQFHENSALIDSISEKLNGSALEPLPHSAQVGDVCVAQFQDDNEFYRARILQVIATTQKYRVSFIDYGNQAMVESLYAQPAELAHIKPLAELHALEHCNEFNIMAKTAREALEALIDGCNGEVVVEFVNKTAMPPVVKLKTNDKNALNIFEQLKKLLVVDAEAVDEQLGANAECIITHGNSPMSFYIQRKKHSADLDLISNVLQNLKSEELPLLADRMQSLNAVCFSQEDACYYRCCIKNVLPDGQSCEVFLIDYGNTITVRELYQLPTTIWEIEPLAVHCKLSEIPVNVDDAKLEEAFTALLEQHFGEIYEIVHETINKDSLQHIVQLHINYKDFAQELANTVAGVEKPVVAELHNCVVVQFNAPNSFYVQMEKDVPALEQMTDKLLDAEQNFAAFNELKAGALCVAQFPEDEVFYRAEIVEVLDAGKCAVHFIDFGNEAVTEQFRQLPQPLAEPPRYSKHCELESAAIAKCDAATLQAFIDSRFSETFQVEILATKGDTHVVRLFYQSTNISEKLRLQHN